MRQSISMDEIPFAPMLDMPVAKLCDTIPPVDLPPAPLPTKRPVDHKLVAWRNDGPLMTTMTFSTFEAAKVAAGELHFLTYWKWAITCGRDTVEMGRIDEPADYAAAVARFEAWHAAQA